MELNSKCKRWGFGPYTIFSGGSLLFLAILFTVPYQQPHSLIQARDSTQHHQIAPQRREVPHLEARVTSASDFASRSFENQKPWKNWIPALSGRADFASLVAKGRAWKCNLDNWQHDTSPYGANTDWAVNGYSQGPAKAGTSAEQKAKGVVGQILEGLGVSNKPDDYECFMVINDVIASGYSYITFCQFLQCFHFKGGTIFVVDVSSPAQAVSTFWKSGEEWGMAAADMEEMRQGRPTVAEYEAHELELKAWSDITFITMAKANAGALSGMNKVVHAHIKNPETKATIDAALSTVGKTIASVQGSPHTFEMGSDQALAIWATPNGKGTYWMLRQHPAELGKKTLGKITVWSTEEPDGHQPWMLLETPLAPQPQQQESAPGAPGGPARVK